MTQEIEKLKAELVAAQCRTDELERGYEDFSEWIQNSGFMPESVNEDVVWCENALQEIKRITGK